MNEDAQKLPDVQNPLDAQEPLKERFFFNDTLPAVDNRPVLIRPRLQRLLDQAVRNPLVTVVAGAGYGKTLAVYSYLCSVSFKTAWIHLSERDNNSWRFWENFVRAMAFLNPKTAAKMVENGFPETSGQFDRYFLIPQQDIKPDIKYIFVFDDFHLIDNESVLKFLERSMTAPFRNVSCIVISRKEPSINTVNLLSKGLLTRITEEELRFTRDEMIEYFRMEGITVPGEAASSLYRDTEGWAFAIHLAGLALRKEEDGDYGRRFLKLSIFNQIEREIFSALSEDMQKHFIQFSLIEHLPLEFLRRLSGDHKLIEEIEKIGSFIRYDPYLTAYRIHPLFLEYLAGKQDRLREEEKEAVYLLAGDWCVDNDQKMDAIGYYEKAGAYDKLMEVVYTLPQTLPEHISLFLLDIMDRAPEELYRRSPRASILHTRLLLILGRLDEAAVEARRIIEKFEALPASAYKSWTLYGSYMNLGFTGMLSNPYSPDYDFSRFFEKGSHHCRLSGIELRGSLTVINVGSYACRVGIARPGEIERYIQAVAATEPHLSASMNGCSFGLTDLVRTEAAYFKGDLDNAIQFAYQSLHKAQKRHQYEIETRTLFYLLRLAIARGKHTRIREFFTFLEAQLGEKDYVNRSIFYDIVTGWFYAHIGQTGKVAPWIMDDMKEPDLNFLMRGSEILARVKVYFAEKKYAAALAVIKDKSPYGLEAFLLGRLEIKVLEAVCLYHEQQPEAALEALEAAYDLSRPNEFTMPFIEMGRDMGLLTRAALKNQRGAIPQTWLEKIANNSAAYAKKMSAVIQNYREETGAPKDRDLDISRRERNILIGLSQGLTREEIARDGAVSINTVKSSISALYSKLGAVNRADAIRIATSLGVLKGGDKE